MKIQELNSQRDEKLNALIEEYGVFFASNQKRFDERKCELESGDHYLALGAGGYIASRKYNYYLLAVTKMEFWYKEQIASHNLRKDVILHALYNHECFYSGEIEMALFYLGSDYTLEEVVAVYNEERLSEHFEL